MGTLSVRENLAFSANLRISNTSVTQQQRREKVSQVIQQLGLQDCADTKVNIYRFYTLEIVNLTYVCGTKLILICTFDAM